MTTSAPSSRILTLHPRGRHGVNIDRAKYDQLRRALLREIPRAARGVPFRSLAHRVRPHLTRDVFPSSAGLTWYVVAVKQDLEARGMIEIVPGRGPQHVRRCAS